MSGKLYVVATPIGNLADISYRAVEILSSVDLIAAEDTRHSQRLLANYHIKTRLLALHDHNEQNQAAQLLTKLQQGKNIALISDAGTPLISDPGYHLLKLLQENNIDIVPVPGACAAIAALSVAALPTDQFYFVGFLPAKKLARQQQLQVIKDQSATLIFYEAVHRIVATLQDMCEVLGAERQAVLARELTKVHETIQRGSLAEIHEIVSKDPQQQKGEFVIIVHGNTQQPVFDAEAQCVLKILLGELPLKQAAKLAAEITGVKKNALYEWALDQHTSRE